MEQEQFIKPFSTTQLPPHLDGSSGEIRCDSGRQQIALENDQQALNRFLEQYSSSPGTFRIYSRECERLALWSVHVKEKPMSSLGVVDIEEFIVFLGAPTPTDVWCGPKARRESTRWRPFVGPLEVSARLTALSAINSMMGFWVDAGYIKGNPLGLFRQLKQKIVSGVLDGKKSTGTKPVAAGAKRALVISQDAMKVDRYLDEDMWSAVVQVIEKKDVEQPKSKEEYERLRFVMAMLYMMAPRVGELESHRMNSFRQERGKWWWYVVGKGSKLAKVPVPQDMLDALVRYRKHLGLTALPDHKDNNPLLGSVRHKGKPITARRLNQLLKSVFEEAALVLPAHASHKADKLRQASAHWGRHTGITAKVDAGMSHLHIQQDARHADFSTTQLYIHGADEARHDDAQKQKINWQ